MLVFKNFPHSAGFLLWEIMISILPRGFRSGSCLKVDFEAEDTGGENPDLLSHSDFMPRSIDHNVIK